MDTKDWVLLITLYEEMNLTRTAKRLYTTQPSLTYRIKQIESSLGIQILHRGNKGISFTAEGIYLVEHSKRMLKEERKLLDHLKNMKDELQGTIRIGSSSNYAHYELPDLLENFIKKYPNIEVELVTGWSSEILEKLQNETIHVAFLRGDFKWNSKKHILEKDNLHIISTNKIDLESLPQENYIQYLTDLSLKNTIDKWWRDNYNSPVYTTMEVDRIETSIEMVKRGLGYTIVPAINIQNENNLYTMPIKDNDKNIYRNTWLAYKEESLNLKVVDEFVRLILKSSSVR